MSSIKSRVPGFRLLILIAYVLIVSAALGTPAIAQSVAPTLRFVTVQGHQLAVRGEGWRQNGRVAFSVRYSGRWTQGRQLRATPSGSFTVAVDNINLCGGSLFMALDFNGRRAALSGPALMCATPLNPPRPIITVVRGTAVRAHQVSVIGFSSRRETTLHVGDVLYFWEAGETAAFSPTADNHFLSLIRQGSTPPKMCAQVTCQQGLFWAWVAIRAGSTAINFSAQCRRSTPPCEVPDFLLRVHILP
jgi:hypothetical protein